MLVFVCFVFRGWGVGFCLFLFFAVGDSSCIDPTSESTEPRSVRAKLRFSTEPRL